MTGTSSSYSLRSNEHTSAQAVVGDPARVRSDGLEAVGATAMSLNHGRDTLITLGDGSTILLKGVAYIDTSLFTT